MTAIYLCQKPKQNSRMIFSATSDIYNAYHLPVAQRCGSPAKTTQYELEAKMKHHFRSERNSNPIERTSPPHSPPPASQPATSPVVLARMRFKSCWIVPVVEKILQMDCWIGFDWIVLGIMQKLVWSDKIEPTDDPTEEEDPFSTTSCSIG